MHSLSDIEVDFIESDLKSLGIVSEDLRDNLLDHICCILETEMNEDDEFDEYYRQVLPRFFKNELSEIQTETYNLLKFKNFYTMKKILNFSGIATVVLTILGALFKSMHWPGAAMLIILGGFSFSIIYMPLLIVLKLKDDESKIDKLVHSFGLILAIFLTAGVLFKIMRWPYANNLMFYSTLLFTFIFVPIYFITRFRKPEKKFNTMVNSVLMIAVGGIFYSMFDMSYSRKYEQLMVENHIYIHENTEKLRSSNERLMAIETANPTAQQFHQLSTELNSKIEVIVQEIIENQSTRGALQFFAALDENVNNYNIQIAELNMDELSTIELKPFKRLNEVNTDLAMNVLARTQQQLAVNENSYLTNLLAHK
ncbi:MAG: hypothetical protein ACJAV5_000777 [Vicingaceae bacterium]|jgi:hypothetical protein